MASIITVPNQKVVRIEKAPCNKNNKYTMINLDALNKAMNDLSNAELGVWLYFAKNQNGYEFALSRQDAAEWNISKTTYHRAIKTFIDKKYLVADKPNSNHYTFHEIPEKGIDFEKQETKAAPDEVPVKKYEPKEIEITIPEPQLKGREPIPYHPRKKTGFNF